ncbi:MAG: hypothetical protein IJE07_00095 [Clostridia bacterium]|nr:hypothetical protein [Clostridia bacterium]
MTEPGWHLPYMTSGERVLWQTEPETRRLSFRWIALGAAAFLALLCVPIGLLAYCALRHYSSPHVPSVIFSVMAACWVGLLLCQGLIPWLLRQMGRKQAEFVVTDRRILRCRGSMVDGLLLHQLPEPILTQEADDTATLTFWPVAARNPEKDSGRANLGSMGGFSMPHIHQADRLLTVLREVRVRHERPRPIADPPLIPLERGEHLLWQGHPTRRDSGIRQLLSGRPIAGESGGWLFGTWAIVAPGGFLALLITGIGWQWELWPVYLFLLVMILAGAVTLRFALRQWARHPRQTDYVLTDRRLIRCIDGFISEWPLDRGEAQPVYLAQGQGGTATLMLCSLPTSRTGQRVTFSAAAAVMEGFQLRAIPDAARVADLIAAVQTYQAK